MPATPASAVAASSRRGPGSRSRDAPGRRTKFEMRTPRTTTQVGERPVAKA
ncbi:hypothetical protein F8B43_4213 [Methylorubrum populi]|uniref:Uncharacterized protein n=1 Tax=Methylorubrum populi TaxID=223967 RepID=A0A833J2J5_9HYPH|nr:hypothetical protein F8B43_4213 [Methylorubrum populi]